MRPISFALVTLFSLICAFIGWTIYNSPQARATVVKYFENVMSDITVQQMPLNEAKKNLTDRLVAKNLTAGLPMFVRVFKEESQLEVWLQDGEHYQLLHSYPICKWSGNLGPKLKEGDHQSPEGFYQVSKKQLNPFSRHHLAFNIGFPNSYDKSLGRTGSYLMVHGGCSSIGCYAITDAYVDEIYSLMEAALNNGQKSVPIHIFPFRMYNKRLDQETKSQWIEFWRELKQGHDLFEVANVPPKVSQCNGHYRFNQSAGADCTQIVSW